MIIIHSNPTTLKTCHGGVLLKPRNSQYRFWLFSWKDFAKLHLFPGYIPDDVKQWICPLVLSLQPDAFLSFFFSWQVGRVSWIWRNMQTWANSHAQKSKTATHQCHCSVPNRGSHRNWINGSLARRRKMLGILWLTAPASISVLKCELSKKK